MLLEHSLKKNDSDLLQIQSMLLQVSGLVEHRFHDALKCFCAGDIRWAEKILQAIGHVDGLEVKLSNACNQLILRHHSEAKDLLIVLATVKVIDELDQVGDEVGKIACAAHDLSERWGVAVNHYEVVRVIAGCAEVLAA